MEHQVLVVDNSYKPMYTVSWDDAIVDIINNRHTVLEYSDKYVNSAHQRWALPEIIVSTGSLRIRKKVKFDYESINARDNHTCAYCGEKAHTVDHIIPQDPKYGGKDSWDNCISACQRCNNRKRNRTPEEAGMKLLFQPITPNNTFELALYRMRFKDNWLPYIPRQVIANINTLQERTAYAQSVASSKRY